jgi:hypothetical protein
MWHVAAEGGTPVPYVQQQDAYPRSFSADGRLLLFMRYSAAQGDLWVLALDSAGARPRPVLATPADEDEPLVSPDSRWLAYATDASGRMEVRVGSLAEPAAGVQVSTAGGLPLAWSRDGRRLFFLNGSDIWEVVVSASGPVLSSATRAFRLPSGLAATLAVLPDGEHAVAIRGGQIYSDVIVIEGALRTGKHVVTQPGSRP